MKQQEKISSLEQYGVMQMSDEKNHHHETPANEQEEAERSRRQQGHQQQREFDHEPEYHERDHGLCDGKPCKRVRIPAERE